VVPQRRRISETGASDSLGSWYVLLVPFLSSLAADALQNKYNNLCATAGMREDHDMSENVAAARALLDQAGTDRREWLVWAGDKLMPATWALVKQDEERAERNRVRREAEEKEAEEARLAEEQERKETEERELAAKTAERRLEDERKTRAADEERRRDFERRKKELEDDYFNEKISQEQYDEELARVTPGLPNTRR
jgi:hypothetical protein